MKDVPEQINGLRMKIYGTRMLERTLNFSSAKYPINPKLNLSIRSLALILNTCCGKVNIFWHTQVYLSTSNAHV